MNGITRRLSALLLCILMALSLAAPALAAEGGPGGTETQEQPEPEEPVNEMSADNKIAGTPYDEAGLLTYRSENGEVTIMSCSEAIMGELYIPAYINGEPVTAIHDYAFLYCAALTAVTVPATVTEVGANAFSCCTQLSSATFEGENVSLGRRAFYSCRDLTQVHFKGKVTLVGDYAFSYCTGLDTFDFQQGVEKVGDYAFENCIGLTTIDVLQNVKEIGSYAFSGCTGLVDVTIPATVSRLGDRVFYECKALERAALDDGMAVTQVGTGLFYDCWELTTVHLPPSWTTIPDETFCGCPRLEYTLPDNLKCIGAYAFRSCQGLPKNLVIPAGVTEIGEGAFQNCKLNSVVLPEGVTEIKAYTFDNPFEKTMTGVTLPEGLISIGKYAFGGNRLESLKLPSTLEVIEDYAFALTSSIEYPRWYDKGTVSEIELPAGLTYVGKYALQCCEGAEITQKNVELDIGNKIAGEPYDEEGLLTYRSENGEVTIMSCSDAAAGELDIPASINGEPVTAINDYAFLYCDALTAVTVPETVTQVGGNAFAYCTQLTSVTFEGEGVSLGRRAFYYCSNLAEVHFAGTAALVGEYAFGYCSGLSTVDFRKGVEKIGDYAFENCTGLTSVNFLEGVKEIGSYAFSECSGLVDATVPATVSSLGDRVFYQCTNLEQAILDDGVSGDRAGTGLFYNCKKLTTVRLPANWTAIPDETFSGCTRLEYTLPDNVKRIGTYAFKSCVGLPENLKLPTELTEIGRGAFQNCNLTCVTLPAALEKIEQDAFYGTKLQEVVILCSPSVFSGKSLFADLVTSAVLPEWWTEIPANMFQRSNLTSISIPEGVTEIGESAFAECSDLTSVRLPSTLTAIGGNAFGNTYALTEITFPDSLKEIGAEAFVDSGLTGVILPPNVETVGDGAFAYCCSLKQLNLDCDISGSSTFSYSINLTEVTFGTGVEVINESCFEECVGLQTVRLPDTLKEIGERAFLHCVALRNIDLPEGLETIGASAFQNSALTELSLPSTLTKVGAQAFGTSTLTVVHLAEGMSNEAFGGLEATDELSAFDGCTALSGIDIPQNWTYIPAQFLSGCSGPLGKITLGDGITAIGPGAFREAVGMTAIILPEGLRSIGAYALYGCTGLTELKLPDGLPEDGLGEYAIFGCSGLKTVSLPTGWTSVPDALFQGNQNIETFEIPEGITRIGEYAFADSAVKTVRLPGTLIEIGAYAFQNCALTELNLPDSVTEIGKCAFRNCALTELKLPGSVTKIGAYAFQNCSDMTQVTLTDGLKNVGAYAFSNTGLTGITIPGSVDTIGMFAFYNCDSLVSVVIEPGVTTIDGLAFGFCDKLTSISIPDSTVNLERTVLYGSNPGQVTVQCSAGSMAEKLVKSLLYLGSNNSSRLQGATFYFDDQHLQLANHYYYLDYQGMSFRIVNSAANEERSYQNYTVKNNISDYYAVLLGWEPSWTSLVVPDDVGGIPVKYFGSNTGNYVTWGLASYAMTRGGPMTSHESNDSQLRSLTVGANMEAAGGDLAYLTQLEEIIFKEGITEISEKAFKGLTGLTSVVMPSTLVYIGDEAFEDCENLSSVTFQEGLEVIELWAFRNTALTDVYLPSTLKELNPVAFDSDVVLHFTGSAGALKYQWLDDQLVLHIDPTLPAQLELYGVRIAQFQGTGLGSQGSYYISTEEAGLNEPVQTVDTNIVAATAPVLVNLDVPNEIVMEAPEEPESVEEPEEIEEPEEPETPPEVEEKPVVYEVVLDVVDAIRNNPLVTACVVAGVALLIILGAWHRWSVARKEDRETEA